MTDNQTQKTNLPDTADTASAEEKNAATDLGKFRDVQALMDAYTALEAEFTRRSQRLKELENATKEPVPPAKAENGQALPQAQTTQVKGEADGAAVQPEISDEVKNAIIEEYLSGVLSRRSVPFVTGGSVVAATRRTPKNLKEAGALAKNYFDNKED